MRFEPYVLNPESERSVVVRISPGEVAKFRPFWNPKVAADRLSQEFEIHRVAYESSVSVPEPYDVREVRFPFPWRGYPRDMLALVMPFVDGTKPYLPSQRRLVGAEIAKAIRLGFRPSLDAPENSLITPEERAILIDVELWEMPRAYQPR